MQNEYSAKFADAIGEFLADKDGDPELKRIVVYEALRIEGLINGPPAELPDGFVGSAIKSWLASQSAYRDRRTGQNERKRKSRANCDGHCDGHSDNPVTVPVTSDTVNVKRSIPLVSSTTLRIGRVGAAQQTLIPDITDEQERPKRRRGVVYDPPSKEEVESYINARGYGFGAEEFLAHYTANGWRQANGNPILDWKACCVTWERFRKERRAPRTSSPLRPEAYRNNEETKESTNGW